MGKQGSIFGDIPFPLAREKSLTDHEHECGLAQYKVTSTRTEVEQNYIYLLSQVSDVYATHVFQVDWALH